MVTPTFPVHIRLSSSRYCPLLSPLPLLHPVIRSVASCSSHKLALHASFTFSFPWSIVIFSFLPPSRFSRHYDIFTHHSYNLLLNTRIYYLSWSIAREQAIISIHPARSDKDSLFTLCHRAFAYLPADTGFSRCSRKARTPVIMTSPHPGWWCERKWKYKFFFGVSQRTPSPPAVTRRPGRHVRIGEV